MSKPSLDHHTQPLGLETLSLLPAQWSGHPPGLPIRAVPVCLSTDKSDAISGNCRRPGSWPLHPPYNLSPSPLPLWVWQHWVRGWSLEQVPEAAWSALGSQVGRLSSIPRCLSSWQRLLALFPCNHLWLPHCLQEESKLRLQRHLLTNRFGRRGHSF